jgi:hypothetical protein
MHFIKVIIVYGFRFALGDPLTRRTDCVSRRVEE